MIIVRLRRATVDELRRAFIACLGTEADQAAIIATLEAQIEEQRTLAASLSAADAAVEAFATWFTRFRVIRAQACADLDRSVAETACARAALSVAQAALELAEAWHKERQHSARTAELRAEEKQASDDLARKREL